MLSVEDFISLYISHMKFLTRLLFTFEWPSTMIKVQEKVKKWNESSEEFFVDDESLSGWWTKSPRFKRSMETSSETEQLDELGTLGGNGKLLCEITRRDGLKGHGNLTNGKNRSRTSIPPLFRPLVDHAREMENRGRSFPLEVRRKWWLWNS